MKKKKNLNFVFVFVALRKKIYILQKEKEGFHVDFMLKILKVKFKG